jgi:sodium/hydrogen exchanger-like protein 6/7
MISRAASNEIDTAVAILILLAMLFFITMTSYVLQRLQIRVIHEAVVSISLGMLVGLILNYAVGILLLKKGNDELSRMLSFDHKYFFNLLLPPIIFNSGYDMHRVIIDLISAKLF